MSLKIIFFDIGSTSGFAHNCNGEITHGQLDFTAAKSRPDRLFRSFNAFDTCLRGLVVDVVVYERPFARGQHATRSLWGQAGALEAAAHGRGFPVLDITPKEVKLFAVGKGTADKAEMTLAARAFLLQPDREALGAFGKCSQYVPDILGEHEADAICGLFYSLKHVSKSAPKAPKKRKST